MGFASAGAGVAKGAAISARTVARLNAKVTMKPVASATSTPRLATAQAPVLPPCWARIHDCGDDLRHHAAVWGLSCGDVGARTSEIQRLGRALESAGIKLGSVASGLTGKSATAMIEALIDGERRGGCWPAWRSAGCAPPGSCPTCPGRWRAGSPITTRCCAAVSAETPVSIAGGLTRLSAYPADTPAWRAYHQRFYERFGLGSLVPLLDVVSDSGIGWPDGYPGTVVPARGWRKIPGAGRRGGCTAGEGRPGDPGWPGSASDPLPGTDACARRCVLFVVVSCSRGSFCLGVSRLVKSGCADVSCH